MIPIVWTIFLKMFIFHAYLSPSKEFWTCNSCMKEAWGEAWLLAPASKQLLERSYEVSKLWVQQLKVTSSYHFIPLPRQNSCFGKARCCLALFSRATCLGAKKHTDLTASSIQKFWFKRSKQLWCQALYSSGLQKKNVRGKNMGVYIGHSSFDLYFCHIISFNVCTT